MTYVVVIALIVSMSLNVLLSVLVYKTSVHSSLVLDKSHSRTTEYTGDLLDRLMAMDFGAYKSYQLMAMGTNGPADAEEADDEFVSVQGPDRGGFGSRLGLTAYRSPQDEINPEEDML